MKMKKFLMAMAIVLAGCLFVGVNKSEAARKETTVETNTVVTDSISATDDIHYYWFDVDKSGYFNVDFKVANPLDDTMSGWDISLLDDEGNVVKDWGQQQKSFSSPNFNWKKGTRLCVKVEIHSTWSAPIGVGYEVKITTTEDTTWEQEYNDTLATATVLPNGEEKIGTSISTSDMDYYTYTVENTGYFQLKFKKANALDDSQSGWSIKVYDADGVKIGEYDEKNTMQSQRYNFKKGTKLYFSVEVYSTWSAPLDIAYSITTVAVEDAAWEQELNNNLSTASTLAVGAQKKGTLMASSDVDYYVYTIGKTGYFQFEFKKADALDDSQSGWTIKLYDVNGVKLAEYDEKNSMQGQRYNLKKGTKLYFSVETYSTWTSPVDVEYSILVKETAASNWEVETRQASDAAWSARIRDAATLKSSKIYGSLLWNSDNDLYKLVVSKDGKVTVKFYTNNTSSNVGSGYCVSIYNSKGKKLKEYTSITANASKTFYAKKGTYYVEVEVQSTWTPPSSYDAYSISATSYQAKTPSMSKKKITYKVKKSWFSTTRTLKWKKVSGVDGYEIQLCKSKKFAAKKTTKLTSNTTSANFSVKKGTYYVRIRAYRTTIDGNKLYGGFTKVKKIKVK